ncbi:MAG: radical SAM protein [Pseudomonadota bacterium]
MQNSTYAVRVRTDRADLWKSKGPLLTHLDMELTERCNNNCIHCYINLPSKDMTAKERELSAEDIKEIIKEAAALGCLTLRFTGGEPLLREDFEELYIFARKQGLKVLLFTNATLISRHLAELFTRIPPLDKIEVSVYGVTTKSYEAVSRIPGSFEAARRGINLLLENKVPFVVKSALLPSNKKEVKAFETWAESVPWMDSPPDHAMFFDLRCRRDSEVKNRMIKKFRLSPEEGLKILTRNREAYLKEMKEFCTKFVGAPGDKLLSCGAGVGSGCVDAYGYFQPCIMLRHPDLVYNIKRGSLRDALNRFFPEVRALKASNPLYLDRCARCFIRGLCDQCPGKSWMEHGTMDTPVKYLCEIAHAQARYFGMLEEDERAWEVTDWRKRVEKFSGKKPLESLKSCLDQ